MQIIEYFKAENKDHWLSEIKKSDWSAGQYLYELLTTNKMKDLTGETTKVLLLTDRDNLASFCVYAEQDDIQPTDLTPWIGFVYTYPQYRGNHYAGKLIEYAEGLAKDEGYKRTHISTGHVGLYEKYGYRFNFQNSRNRHFNNCNLSRGKKTTDVGGEKSGADVCHPSWLHRPYLILCR